MSAWPVYSPFAREHYDRGFEEGKAKGMAAGKVEEAARMVLLVLAARGIAVPDNAFAKIATCTDVAQLETWVARAVTTQTIDDLFNEENE
ncbi:hypothetical protein [Nonomuraea sp. NPDC050643]|uniref:hypothetical protein n=1 Tax=Nonomuraea sp. NPDC050643 TaxID=3155660 RepID=UPI00340C8140